jgi:transposase-like protein
MENKMSFENCPFCGSTDIEIENLDENFNEYVCDNCGAYWDDSYYGEEE